MKISSSSNHRRASAWKILEPLLTVYIVWDSSQEPVGHEHCAPAGGMVDDQRDGADVLTAFSVQVVPRAASNTNRLLQDVGDGRIA